VAVSSRRLAAIACVALGGCPTPEPQAPVVTSTARVRVRVFTEPSPVRLLASAGRFVFVGTDNDLERWDDKDGVLPMSAQNGLSGSQIVALAPDHDRHLVWILTEGGLGHYDVKAEVYRELGAPPASIGLDFAAIAKEGGVVAPSTDGGAWLGTKAGLVYVSALGGWASTPIKEPIQGLVRDRAGWLWVATKGGLVARKPTGETVRIGVPEGCGVMEPRLLVELADGMLVIGADDTGRDRLAFGKQLAWTTYRALPEVHWDAAARRGTGAVVMAADRLYRITPADASKVRPLARDGMRLVAMGGSASNVEWMIDPVDLQVPAGALSLQSVNDQLLIGTRDLGTARYRDGDPSPRDWMRRREMFRDATNLSVACMREQDCWIATGSKQAWHWTGDRFVSSGPEQQVLAVVRDPSGPIYALHGSGTENAIVMSRVDATTAWTRLPKISVATPGAPEISFARFASPGTLWIGLRYHDGQETRGYGIAIVDIASGKVAYHRNEPGADAKEKMWPVPMGVVDADVRGDVAWFATTEGIARLAKGKVDVWTEADGLRSELARAVTIAPDGSVIVATGAGAGRWDGKAWDFPAALRFEINDVVATRNGQIWMATERGIAAWDGHKVRRVDTRRGLAENAIVDIAVDQFDRVWARGAGSLTLISQ
jgi:hypothetical protein